MKAKILIVFLIFFNPITAQVKEVKQHFNTFFLYFLPGSNNLVSVVTTRHLFEDSVRISYSIMLLSGENGETIEEIPLSDGYIEEMAISHNGDDFVVLLSSRYKPRETDEILILKRYSLNEKKWLWKKELYGKNNSMQIRFSQDCKQIIGVSSENIYVIDAKSGKIIKESNAIRSVKEGKDFHLKTALSSSGKYAAVWWRKYMVFSLGDDGGFATLLDYLWYGLRWLFYFGSIPNYLYVWDVSNDLLLAEIKIPYEAIRGVPLFNVNETQLLIEYSDFEYLVFSLTEKKDVRKFEQNGPGFPEKTSFYFKDGKSLSPDEKWFSQTYDDEILIIDYADGKLIYKEHQASESDWPGEGFAMAFSPDGKHFAGVTSSYTDTLKLSSFNIIIELGNEISFYETGNWKKLWDKKLSEK